MRKKHDRFLRKKGRLQAMKEAAKQTRRSEEEEEGEEEEEEEDEEETTTTTKKRSGHFCEVPTCSARTISPTKFCFSRKYFLPSLLLPLLPLPLPLPSSFSSFSFCLHVVAVWGSSFLTLSCLLLTYFSHSSRSCSRSLLPLSDILRDPNQKLFSGCVYQYPEGHFCNYPIIKSQKPPYCMGHSEFSSGL
jgi:hypothetical protein